MKRYGLIFLVSFLMLLTGCILTQEKETHDLVIASINPLSGDSAQFGEMKVKAIKLAIDEVNAKGGIHGQKVRLISEDDESSAGQAHRIAEKVVKNPEVLAVIGNWNSACTLASRFVYNGVKMPTITDSINKSITDGTTPYIFRISLTDDYQARQLAEYIFTKLHFRRAAIIYTYNDFGKGLKNEFQRHFEILGGEITATEPFFEVHTDNFSAELKKIQATGAEVIFIASYYFETASIMKQARGLGINLPFVGTEGISSEELIRLGGKEVEGVIFAGFFHPTINHNQSEQFVAAFRAAYQQEPDSYAALAYDSARILFDAFKHGATTREAIYNYLDVLENFPGVTGNISFDHNHDAESKIIVFTIKNGKIVPAEIQ